MLDEREDHVRINDIRTERLSRTLRAMDEKKSPPIPDSKSPRFIEFDREEWEQEKRTMMMYKNTLTRAHSSSTIDDLDSVFRTRDSSITRRNQFRSVRIPANQYTHNGQCKGTSTRKSPRMGSLNRFIRNFMSTYSSTSVDGHQPVKRNRSPHRLRDRTMTVCHTEQLTVPISLSPATRLRSVTEVGTKNEKTRRFTLVNSSKSTSSGGSSRSVSPNHTALITGMMGCLTSEQQQFGSKVYNDRKFTILVVGSSGVGKSALIGRFVQEDWKKSPLKYDSVFLENDSTVTVITDGEESELRFIEVNNQKSDLWLSLSGAAFTVLYNFDDSCSFHNAIDVIARLRERQDTATKPIVLVSNKQTMERKRFVIANDDGRQVAKRNNCSFYEVYVGAGRSALDLLTGMAQEVRRYYLQPEVDQSKIDDGNTPDEDISPPLFDYTSSAVASLGIGFLQPRASAKPHSMVNKANSMSSFGQKLWKRKKVKATKSADTPEVIERKNKSLVMNGIHKCFFGMRRGSRSLETIHLVIK